MMPSSLRIPDASGPITTSPQAIGHWFASAVASAGLLRVLMVGVEELPQSAADGYTVSPPLRLESFQTNLNEVKR